MSQTHRPKAIPVYLKGGYFIVDLSPILIYSQLIGMLLLFPPFNNLDAGGTTKITLSKTGKWIYKLYDHIQRFFSICFLCIPVKGAYILTCSYSCHLFNYLYFVYFVNIFDILYLLKYSKYLLMIHICYNIYMYSIISWRLSFINIMINYYILLFKLLYI